MPEKLNTEKLHIALAQALEDVKKAEQDPQYEVHMEVWHDPGYHKKHICSVCLAGSTLYRADIDHKTRVSIVDIKNQALYNMLDALDDLRQGFIRGAVKAIYGSQSIEMFNVIVALDKDKGDITNVSDYDNYPEAWHEQMQDILIFLKELDL